MTYEEAIKVLTDTRVMILKGSGTDLAKACSMAIEALEKQIPKNYGWTETCLATQKILIEHGVEPLGELANAIFDAVPHREENKNDWIPCSERLPEDDVDVLIYYRDKDEDYKGEDGYDGIAISHYGNVKFGGRLLVYKEWRAPWEYFHKGYDVIAWRPLPEPYKDGE